MSNPLLIQPTQPNVESTLAAWVESPTFSGQGRVARSSSEHGAAHKSQLRLIHSNVICGGFIGVMILTNSVFIGIQTDVAAADWSAVVPPFFVVSALPRLLGAWLVR